MAVNVIVQARMGSKRFPGKVMKKMAGKPMIGHLITRLRQVQSAAHVVYAIPEKDFAGPLGDYLRQQNCAVIAGDEKNVAGRFRQALELYPCEAFVRVCADSPLLPPDMVDALIDVFEGAENMDFMANAPGYGWSVQICRTEAFLEAYPDFDKYDKEHVLSYFSRQFSMLVDTQEDFSRVERMILEEDIPYFPGFSYDT